MKITKQIVITMEDMKQMLLARGVELPEYGVTIKGGVEYWANDVEFPIVVHIEDNPPVKATPFSIIPHNVQQEVVRLTRSSRKIDAIKLLRTHTGWGLKEAKDWCDQYSP